MTVGFNMTMPANGSVPMKAIQPQSDNSTLSEPAPSNPPSNLSLTPSDSQSA